MKKFLKYTRRFFMVALSLLVVLLIFTSIFYRVKLHKIMNTLEPCRCLVSAGDYDLNVSVVGNKNGKHTIVCCAGLNDGTMNFSWRKMTKYIEKDNKLLFIDRAGYGLSEDTKEDRTVDQIVEDYRTVLKNLGEEGPYILMGHSIGGMYTSYWQSKYPEEVEGLIIMDGTLCNLVDEEEKTAIGKQYRFLSIAEKVGLEPFVMKKFYYNNLLDNVSDREADFHLYLFSKTTGSHATISEVNLIYDNAQTVWNSLEPNDVPKVFIDASYQVANDQSFEKDYWIPYAEKMGNCEIVPLYGNHSIYFEKPKECANIVMNFISGLE
ncbi:alpha/beta fold hydrolase [Pseudobutyrivibrio sp.]|uniref:alpha/beta fold hydrolase n=1 Tax=Pseudobutyrivibrio sp. TaxID=2014367 RepID=UPI0025D8F9ED|nr:alpha/beta hydrolase [Pseudobutyrivibrio sp.]MBR5649594.1 alpha/beta hydrolase [Pseudobutyrivibrio sp.]